MIKQFLLLAGQAIPLTYMVLDGHFGNNNALQMVLPCGLHLVSKLRCDSALYFPYEGPDKRRKYGGKIGHGSKTQKVSLTLLLVVKNFFTPKIRAHTGEIQHRANLVQKFLKVLSRSVKLT